MTGPSTTEAPPPAPGPDTAPPEGILRRPATAVVGLTLLAAVAVLVGIGRRSLWFDEGASVGTVDRPFGDALWRMAHWELNQSAFYLLLWPWSRLTHGDVGLRLLPAALAVATVPVLYTLARRLVGSRAALVGCLFFALQAFIVEWAQQVRGYTLAVLVVTLSALLLVRAVEVPSWGRIVLYGLVAGVSVYGHFFGGIAVAAQALALLVLRPVPWRVALGAGTVAAVIAAPAVVFAATAEGDPLSWTAGPRRADLVGTLATLAGGHRASLVVVALAVVGVVVLLVPLRRRWGSTEAFGAVLLVAWLVVPLVAAVVLSAVLHPLLVARYLIVVVPALVLLAAVGAVSLPGRVLPWAAVGLVVLVSLGNLAIWYRGTSYEDWRRATEVVRASAGPGEVVVVVPDRAEAVVRHYGLDGDEPPPVVDRDELRDGTPPGVWVIERRTVAAYRPEDGEILDDLAARFEVVFDEEVHGVRVAHFVPTAP